jgi:transposase
MKKGTFKISKKTTKGKTYYTAAIVKSYRENGKVKQKTIKSFGGVTRDEAQRLKFAYTVESIDGLIHIDDIECEEGVSYGGVYLARHLWEQIGLDGALKGCRGYFPDIFAMVCQRLFEPDSKLQLVEWAPDTALSYLVGLRLEGPVPYRCYQALDKLIENIDNFEDSLPAIAKKFNQDLRRLYYDITSTYFEGNKVRIALYGYSRDSRPDKKQIVIGLVTTPDGFPLKVLIAEGNRCDKSTIEEIVRKIKKEFPGSEITLVLDRGMITRKNLELIETSGFKYIIALRKSDIVNIVSSPLKESEMQLLKEGQYVMPHETLTDRYAVVLNTQKRDDDRRYREEKIEVAMKELERLNNTIRKGHLKDRDKIIAKISLIVKRHKVKRYITWGIPEGKGFLITYKRNDKEITKDELYDGVYVLRTNRTDMIYGEIVNAYKQLSRVEMAFRCLKDTLEIRPVYHWKEKRVRAHVYICVISYLVHTVMEYLLKNNGIQLGADTFLKRVNKVKLITLTDEDGKVIARKVTKKVDDEAKAGLKVFGINVIKAKKMYWRK